MADNFRDSRKFGALHNRSPAFAPIFFHAAPHETANGPAMPATTNPPYIVPPPDPAFSGGPGTKPFAPPSPPPQTVQTMEPFDFPMFNNVPFNYDTTPQLALSSTAGMRVYLMLINLSGSQIAWVSFGTRIEFDGFNNTVPGGIPLPPNYGFLLLDNRVPQNDVYVTGDGQGAMTVVYGNMMPLTVQPGTLDNATYQEKLQQARHDTMFTPK